MGSQKLIELQEAIAQYKERKEYFTDQMKYVFIAGATKITNDLIDECGAIREIDEILNELEKEMEL